MTHEWVALIARTSVVMGVAGACVLVLSRWRPLASPRWHRIAWGIVLAQGLMLFPLSLRIAKPSWWAEATPVELPTESSRESPPAASATNYESPVESWADVSPFIEHERAPSESTAFLPLSDAAPVVKPPTHSPEAKIDDVTAPASATAWSQVRDFAANFVFMSQALAATWCVGALAVLGALAVNYVLLLRSLRACQPARPRWAAEMQQLCLELGLAREVRLDVHPSLGPLLCWTPRGHRVVVPVRLWNRLPAAERLAVLHHELCHFRRGDLCQAFLARVVVALHWFNPLAWVSARRFDESAEWACDAWMAQESPARIPQLASALLSASQSRRDPAYLAVAVTGGALFQRVRRLVSDPPSGDTLMRKCIWTGLLAAFVLVGGIRLRWELPALSAQEPTDKPAVNAEETTDSQGASDDAETIASSAGSAAAGAESSLAPAEASPLAEVSRRIVTGDSESLKKFVALLQTPAGQVVMADRAALTARDAMDSVDPDSQWQQFTNKYFERVGGHWGVKSESGADLAEYVRSVKIGVTDLEQIAQKFREIAPLIAEQPEVAPVLRRFLEHEAAPAFVYHSELRTRLHPGMEQIEERFQEHLVRTRSGSYVIRPTRRGQVEKRLAFVEKLQKPLGRFEKELAAWAEDLVKGDDVHDQFAATLRRPEFAKYIVFSHMSEESPVDDEELDDVFGMLEEATTDTAAGLKLLQDSDPYREIKNVMDRFHAVWDDRASVADPLHRLTDRIEAADELHERLKAFLKTDLALLFVARDMEYLPIAPEAAARDWLAQIVTKNEAGKYEITLESTEELKNRIEEFFREYREMRRRGRLVDEFAAELADADIKTAMQSLIGKLSLAQLVEASVERPDVDGLTIWVENHFEEAPAGLVLREGAAGVIDEVLAEAAEIEKELAKQDF